MYRATRWKPTNSKSTLIFLEYPELELSNNLAENSMRPVALGRKNWVHLGSKEAGPRVAAIVSIVETCRRLNLPIRDYLGSVLPGLGRFSVQSKRRTHAQRLGRTKIAVAVIVQLVRRL